MLGDASVRPDAVRIAVAGAALAGHGQTREPKAIASAMASTQNSGQWPRAAARHSQSPLSAPCSTGTSAVLTAAAHNSSRAACAGRQRGP